ncbi:MAG: hypothetical protein QW063_00395 [Candidatus Nanoarchaeia archaeon]
MDNKKGNALLIIAVVILILLVVGLWYYPHLTKDLVSGAVSRVRNLIP